MKIEGPGKTTGPKGASKADAKKTGDGTFGAMVSDADESAASAPVSRPAPVNTLDTLLALQAAEGSSEEASKRARKRASDLLDHLDKVKIGLLTGELPRGTLQQLSQTISTHRSQIMDPKLTEILDEIDLRAQVELAKLGY
jgi:hypothetical protein